MDKILGLYLSLESSGKIKRNLTKLSGEVELAPATIDSEIIEFSEVNFLYYAQVLEDISMLSEETEDDNRPEDFGIVYMDVFEKILRLTEDLVNALEEDNHLHGFLTKALLEDCVPKDDGTAMYVYNAKSIIVKCLESIMLFHFKVNDVLNDLSQSIPFDFENKYAYLKQTEVVQIFNEELTTQYRFRSLVNYYKFLLVKFIYNKPNVKKCEYCGRFFIPKTKSVTLYCDRIIKNAQTCKDLGPAKKHKFAAQHSEIIQLYDREKQKWNSRVVRARDSNMNPSEKFAEYLEFCSWNDKATAARDAYFRDEISEDEAMEIILEDTWQQRKDSAESSL